ncbi:calcium-binding protein, partial [Vibrio parahaemolyticus]|nr:calcium-binding protein [Vibrio parahaemolyticus]
TKAGANTYAFGKDKVIGDGGGIDTLSAASSKTKVMIDLNGGAWSYANKKSSSLLKDGQMVIGHGTTIERATGSKYNDTIRGNEADNLLKGGAGNDSLDGRTGNDRVYGESGNDKLYGGWGDDLLSGSSGNDRLQGGQGADRLYGGSDKDTFYFASLSEMGTPESHDRIYDFSKAQGDVMDFRKVDFNLEAAGRQKGKFLGNSSGDYKFNDRAGEFYYNKPEKAFHFDADGDGVTDFVLQTNLASVSSKGYFLL